MRNYFYAIALAALLASTSAKANSVSMAQLEQFMDGLNMSKAQKTAAKPVMLEGINERLGILKAAGIKKGEKPSLAQLLKVRSPIKASLARTDRRMAKILDANQTIRYQKAVEKIRKQIRAQYQ